MFYCPNCAADVGKAADTCPKCSASFGEGAVWKPTPTPPARPPAVDSKSSTGMRVVKGFFMIPPVVVGIVLLVIAARLSDSGGSVMVVPAILFFLLAAGIAVARSAAALAVNLGIAAVLLVLFCGAFYLIGAAMHAR